MTAHRSDAKYVTLKREMGGDKGENVEWDTIDRSKRVPPLADRRQCGQGILLELRNHIEGGAVPKWRLVWPLRVSRIRDVRLRICHALQLFVQSKDEL
jgi:hypothetical protein